MYSYQSGIKMECNNKLTIAKYGTVSQVITVYSICVHLRNPSIT